MQFVYPVHLNPNVQEPVYRLLSGIPNITLLPPLDYLPLVQLIKSASLVLTDSGGIQEEAPGFGVPVWCCARSPSVRKASKPARYAWWARRPRRIVLEARRLLDDPQAHAAMAQAVNPYGDGHAAGRIVQAILEHSQPW